MLEIYKVLKTSVTTLKKEFFSQSFDTHSLVAHCVDSSTIRAFHRDKQYSLKYQPLSIFRVWAFDYLNNGKFLNKLSKKKTFKAIRDAALTSLMDYWSVKDKGRPLFHHFNKLIDLLFKSLPLWNKLDRDTKLWVFESTNVPLDKYTLGLLKKSSSKMKIPSVVSMGYINEANYDLLQEEIKNICNGIAPLVFDLHAWKHRRSDAFSLIPLAQKKDIVE